MVNRKAITPQQVQNNFTLLSWWLALSLIPFAKYLVVYLCNRTSISPNQITAASFCFRILTAACFLTGSSKGFIIGGGCFYLACLLDAVDGPVARLTGQMSPFGRYFDHLSDLFGDIVILICLAISQGLLFTPMVLGLAFMHLAESYISYLTNLALDNRKNVNFNSSFFNSHFLFKAYKQYRDFFFQRNLKSFLSYPDYCFLAFIVFPLLNKPAMGLFVGFYVILIIVLYTIFSTFVTLHSGKRLFP